MPDKLTGRLTPERRLDGTLNNKGTLRGMLGGTGAVVTYASLPDKPSINGVTLVGNKTTSDLNINYNDIKNLPSIPDVGEIDERLDNLEGDITSLGGRVTTAEGNITSLGGRVTTAEGNITTLQGDTSALDTRLTTAEGNITSLDGRVTTNESDISDLQGDTSALDTRITTAEGNITSLGGRVTTAEGNITSLDGRVTTNEGSISDLQGDMTQAQSDITQLNFSIVNKIGGKYISQGKTMSITFSEYASASIIFGTINATNYIMYLFGNGYLVPIKTINNVNVSLSSDYRTISITNNYTSSTLWVGVLNTFNVDMSIN